jgi:hypothetical protein
MDSIGSRTIKPLFKSQYFFYHDVIYSSRVRTILHSINKGGYTYLEPLGGHMYLICMLCNINLTP